MLHLRFENDVDPRACLDQIDRLTRSPLLRGSDAHCRLIRFLAEHSLNSPSDHLKEYQIATEALGRPPGFDPQSDSSVRVQMSRLRDKLAEYYRSIGSQDPILVEIPKGRYALSFQNRTPIAETTPPIRAVPNLDAGVPVARRHYRIIAFAFSVLLAGVLAVFIFAHSHPISIVPPSISTSKAKPAQTALGTMWSVFVDAPEQPFVVFRNRTLFGDPAVGMRHFDPSRDNPNQQIQRYTGVGEVMSIFELTQLFDSFGSHFRVKREGLFTIDDARKSNVIFVGSPDGGRDSSEIPGTREFTLRRMADGSGHFKWAVVDSHPQSRGTGIYAGSSGVDAIKTAYAIVALKRGLDQSHWTLFLEGTSTIATQGAVDYVCDERSVIVLVKRLHFTSSTSLKPFEGLLRVKITNDVPVETDLLDLRETRE